MSGVGDLVRKGAKLVVDELRSRRLEAGEAGWGRPVPLPPAVKGIGADRCFRVGVVGAGSQGIAQCQGFLSLAGIKIAGLAERDPERLKTAGDTVNLPAEARFDDAERMLRDTAPLDLVAIATTAPFHVQLGRLALRCGARRILLEKPMDTSLREARAFHQECRAAAVPLAVNYSRRWLVDYRGIRRCLAAGAIGEPRSVSVAVGKGELAMHASHFFDLCRYLLAAEPAWIQAHLEPLAGVNPRGQQYQDPSGFCLIGFQNGARAFIDFSSDFLVKDEFLMIKGTGGQVTVDEKARYWTLESRSQRVWTFPFVDEMRSFRMFARVAAALLSDEFPACSGEDGLATLAMILAAHHSAVRAGSLVSLPLSPEDETLHVVFP